MQLLFFSWADYCTSIIAAVVIYYITVAALYYRNELLRVLGLVKLPNSSITAESKRVASENGLAVANGPMSFMNEDQEDALSLQFQSCRDEIKACLQQLANYDPDQSSILHSLALILSKYPALQLSSYRESMEDLMISESDAIPGIQLRRDELKQLW